MLQNKKRGPLTGQTFAVWSPTVRGVALLLKQTNKLDDIGCDGGTSTGSATARSSSSGSPTAIIGGNEREHAHHR